MTDTQTTPVAEIVTFTLANGITPAAFVEISQQSEANAATALNFGGVEITAAATAGSCRFVLFGDESHGCFAVGAMPGAELM